MSPKDLLQDHLDRLQEDLDNNRSLQDSLDDKIAQLEKEEKKLVVEIKDFKAFLEDKPSVLEATVKETKNEQVPVQSKG